MFFCFECLNILQIFRSDTLKFVSYYVAMICTDLVSRIHENSEICERFGYYSGYSNNSLSTFRLSLSNPSSRVNKSKKKKILTLKDGIDKLSRNVGKELPLTLRNISEERRSRLLGGGCLKSHTKILLTCEIYAFALLDCAIVQSASQTVILRESETDSDTLLSILLPLC